MTYSEKGVESQITHKVVEHLGIVRPVIKRREPQEEVEDPSWENGCCHPEVKIEIITSDCQDCNFNLTVV